MDKKEKAPNKTQFERFKEHIELPNNSRIIFSGKFGIGKTTFLKDFFDERKAEFNTIHLYPINYSISQTEDILNLLKFDIINELVENFPITTEEFNFTKSEILSWFLISNAQDIIIHALKLIPKIGKTIPSGLKTISELITKYEEFEKQINAGEKEAINAFQEKIKEKEGGIYNDDFIKQFIKKKLKEIRGEDEGKRENVLIIDDLDRIDPEHIFRLFNVFAAHLHSPSDEANEFGFDKIIFTCDIENIKSIYHHRYGQSTDFSGYIDKFYTKEIFPLDNSSAIQYWIEERTSIRDYPIFKNGESVFITNILTNMLKLGEINFRNIRSINRDVIKRHYDGLKGGTSSNELVTSSFIWIAPILSLICGGSDMLIDKLYKTKERMLGQIDKSFCEKSGMVLIYIERFLIPVALYKEHGLGAGARYFNMSAVTNPDDKSYFKYEIVNEGMDRFVGKFDKAFTGINSIPVSEELGNRIIWDFIINAVKTTKRYNYLT